MSPRKIKITILPLTKVPISDAKEKTLLAKWQRGNEEIREVILKKYFPFIASISRKYHNYFPWIDFVELVEEGNYGLLQALEHYDRKKKAKFTSYAWFWITKSMQEYISQQMVFLKIPARVMRDLRKIEKQIEKDIQLRNDISLPDIVKRINVGLDEIKSILGQKNAIAHPLSLDQSMDDEDEKQTLKDIIKGQDIPSEIVLEENEDRNEIEELLYKLTEDEAEIVRWRFGFKDNNYHSLKEISLKMKVSAQRVKDLETQAIIKLKRLLAEKSE